ncbi:ALQxL family class IV lanthipeptide [Streptomyces sp. DH37]|jgi:hypothetical protein|nr:ALQxL family class IV lanthipeptide [Streptomyces sp. DH37]MDG9700864.1 ALQxL family class IV lanthipeptide [Streptomyces sp. DH37]
MTDMELDLDALQLLPETEPTGLEPCEATCGANSSCAGFTCGFTWF